MNTKLSNSTKNILSKALLIRKVENALLKLYADGDLHGTVHTCVGQELIGPTVCGHLNKKDFVFTNHRGHGHYIAHTDDVKGLIAEIMGRETGLAGGIGGSQHLVNKRFLSNGIQGGMTPIALGIAMGGKINGENNISCVFIGDGTLGEGVLYEALNLCAIWKLSVIFVLENNGYAQSTSFRQVFAGDIESRVTGFGLKYYKTDTWNIDDLNSTLSQAINTVRSEGAPALVEIKTYRLNSHSKGDDNRRSEEVEMYRKKDVLTKFIDENSEHYKNSAVVADKIINDAIKFAKASPMLTSVENPSSYNNQTVQYIRINIEKSEKRYNELIYQVFDHSMKKDPDIILIGEDIEYKTAHTPQKYGGAFKVTKDLSEKYPGRVLNTPISEAAIIGTGTGLALSGKKPVIEIMFGDFMTLCFDQIYQHAAKFKKMYNGAVSVPLIIRTPMGGRRGYGPTHSQSIEKFFIGIPGLLVVVLNKFLDPAIIYTKLLNKIDQPVLVIENKVLYTQTFGEGIPVGFDLFSSDELFPTIKIKIPNVQPQLSIVCYGGVIDDVLAATAKAFDEHEFICEIIVPSVISTPNVGPILESVNVTHKLLTIEEGPGGAAYGSELVSGIIEQGVNLDRLIRLSNNGIIPSSIKAENELLPNKASIYKAIETAM